MHAKGARIALSGSAPFKVESLEGRRMLSAAPAAAPAQKVTVSTDAGTHILAQFDHTDSAGVEYSAEVQVQDIQSVNNGVASHNIAPYVFLSVFDNVHFTGYLFAGNNGNFSNYILTTSGAHGHVAFQTVALDQNTGGGVLTVDVDLNWVKNGPTTTAHSVQSDGTSLENFGDEEYAVSVTGSITIEGGWTVGGAFSGAGFSIPASFNFAATPSIDSEADSFRDVTVTWNTPSSAADASSLASDIFASETPILS